MHIRDAGSIPGWARSPGGGNDSPLQHSCLEDPMDRGACNSPQGCQESDSTEVSEHAQAKPQGECEWGGMYEAILELLLSLWTHSGAASALRLAGSLSLLARVWRVWPPASKLLLRCSFSTLIFDFLVSGFCGIWLSLHLETSQGKIVLWLTLSYPRGFPQIPEKAGGGAENMDPTPGC